MTYHGWALNADGRIGLLRIVRTPHGKSQTWTGETYQNNAKGANDAASDCGKRNGCAVGRDGNGWKVMP